MATFGDIKYRFSRKDILMKLIIINVVIFLLFALASVFATLFKLGDIYTLTEYLGVSSDVSVLITRPWTLFTYMFVHDYDGILHILFNMLFLFWFGQIFLTYFNSKNLGSVYVLGGLSGALLYIVLFNTIPYYIDMPRLPMIGASGAVTAIIFAASFYNPNHRINLFLFGSVKIMYVAIVIFVVDFIAMKSTANPGGHVAHIGGAILGYIYAKQYQKGKDITRWVTRLIDALSNLFKAKPNMKVKYKRKETDYEYNQRKHAETQNIDKILDKIKASGYGSLTQDEKKQLFDASKK